MRGKLNPWLGAAVLTLASGAAWSADGAEGGELGFGAPVEAQALDEYRGREESRLEMNWQETYGSVEGNSASRNVNGANIIRDGAFSNASGLPITVQNSGNNVLIQNSIILNLDMQ